MTDLVEEKFLIINKMLHLVDYNDHIEKGKVKIVGEMCHILI